MHTGTVHLTSDLFHLQIWVCYGNIALCVDRHLLHTELLQHLRNTDDCPETTHAALTHALLKGFGYMDGNYDGHKLSMAQLADPSGGWLSVISLMSPEYHGNSNPCFPRYVSQERADGNMWASLILKQTTVGNVWTLHELWFVNRVWGIVEISSDIPEHKYWGSVGKLEDVCLHLIAFLSRRNRDIKEISFVILLSYGLTSFSIWPSVCKVQSQKAACGNAEKFRMV